MYDIVIIGAGPAGSNLARLIGKNKKVLLLEARDFKNELMEKSCGGLLNPDAMLEISKQGLSIPADIVGGPQSVIVRTIDIDNNIIGAYKKSYININRRKFDAWLYNMCLNSVDTLDRATFLSCKYEDSNIIVNYRRDGKLKVVTTKILVGADGGDSRVRKYFKPDSISAEKYFGVQELCHNPNNYSNHTALFSSKINDSYSWIIPKNEGLIIGTAFKNSKNIKEKFELLKDLYRSKGIDIGEKISSSGAIILRPKGARDVYLGDSKIAFIGEAAGLISPSSFEGISFALKSSKFLAESILESENNFSTLYKKKLRSLIFYISLKSIKSKLIYCSKSRALIMKSRIGNIKI